MSSNLTTAGDRASSMIDTAAQSADDAIRGSQRLANQALDQLAGKVESARSAAGPAVQGLASDAAQRWYAEVNSEYPVNPAIPPSATLKAWGEFKADSLNLERLGELNGEALRLMDRAGWK